MGEIIDFDKYKERKRRCDNTIIPNPDISTSLHTWLRDIYKDIGKNIDKENK